MTTSLNTAAQILLDLYYQDYAPEDSYIDLIHVKTLMYSEYERMNQDDYNRAKILNRTMEGFGFVTIDSDGMITETIDISKHGPDYIGELPGKAFSFGDFDSMGSGVQRVRNLDEECPTSELIRIAQSDAWIHCIAPPSGKAFFYPQTTSKGAGCPIITKIVVLGACHPKKVEVQYLPGLSDDGDMQIASRMVKRITDAVLQTLLIAKQQVVIDKTNDSNPNTAIATEANPDNVKNNP